MWQYCVLKIVNIKACQAPCIFTEEKALHISSFLDKSFCNDVARERGLSLNKLRSSYELQDGEAADIHEINRTTTSITEQEPNDSKIRHETKKSIVAINLSIYFSKCKKWSNEGCIMCIQSMQEYIIDRGVLRKTNYP